MRSFLIRTRSQIEPCVSLLAESSCGQEHLRPARESAPKALEKNFGLARASDHKKRTLRQRARTLYLFASRVFARPGTAKASPRERTQSVKKRFWLGSRKRTHIARPGTAKASSRERTQRVNKKLWRGPR